MSTKTATLEHKPPYVRLRCSYDAALVTLLRNLPRRARRWSKDERTWIVASEYADWLESLLQRLGYDVVWLDNQPQQRTAMPPALAEAYATLYVSHHAPPEVIDAAYRSLAKLYHPDSGIYPREEAEMKMKRLNMAYEALKRQLAEGNAR